MLRKGTQFAYSVWCGLEVEGAFGWVVRAIQQHGDGAISLRPVPDATVFGTLEVAFPALREVGFSDISAESVPSVWISDDPTTPYHYFHEGTVCGGALLRPQPAASKQAICLSIIGKVREHCGPGDKLSIPMPAVLVSASAV